MNAPLLPTIDWKGKFPDEKMKDVKTREQFVTIVTVNTCAIAFMGTSGGGSDWHYAGKGASLHDKDQPILWYRPKTDKPAKAGDADKNTYHVIDAALHITEVPASALPTIPSVKIDPSKLMTLPATQPATTPTPDPNANINLGP
ncbi:MAG: hypothetical protein FWD61_19900 [Phycisphaerales bacterium]|nr:hypothetical protein [Phycisphaerales bacterium]